MISIAFALAAASVAEQMTPAKQGMLQCQLPDELFKTCLSLGKVYQTGPATWVYETEMAINDVVVSMSTEVFVRGSQLCDVIDLNDLDHATYKTQGRPASPSQVAEVKSTFRRMMGFFKGKTVCTSIVAGAEGLGTDIMQATIGGKRIPEADYAVRWVSPNDGWKVAP